MKPDACEAFVSNANEEMFENRLIVGGRVEKQDDVERRKRLTMWKADDTL